MAIVAIINSYTANEVQDIGDIVHVFKDTHVFSPMEEKQFTLRVLPGTVTTYQDYIRSISTITSEFKFPVKFTGTTLVIKEASVKAIK